MTDRAADAAAVRRVIEKYVEGSAQRDVEMLRAIFHPQAVMMGYLGDQAMEGTPEPFFTMVEGATGKGGDGGDADYRGEIVHIEVYDRIAIATLVETGFFGMNFVDSFHLMKGEGGWLITSKLFVRE